MGNDYRSLSFWCAVVCCAVSGMCFVWRAPQDTSPNKSSPIDIGGFVFRGDGCRFPDRQSRVSELVVFLSLRDMANSHLLCDEGGFQAESVGAGLVRRLI
jgi:hypothetical protein